MMRIKRAKIVSIHILPIGSITYKRQVVKLAIVSTIVQNSVTLLPTSFAAYAVMLGTWPETVLIGSVGPIGVMMPLAQFQVVLPLGALEVVMQ